MEQNLSSWIDLKKYANTRSTWGTQYAPDISELLEKIPIYYERIKRFVKNPGNSDFLNGFCKYYRIVYLSECNRGENTGTQTFRETETALINKNASRDEIKTQNLSNAIDYLFGKSLLVETLQHEFTPSLARKINRMIGEELFSGGSYRQTHAMPSGYNQIYLAPHLIEKRINQLFDKINRMKITTTNYYSIAAQFLVEFLFIHPFVNGNGRTARLLISVILKKYSLVPVPLFPSCWNRVDSNSIYLNCIVESCKYNNYLLINSLIIESVYYTLYNFIHCLDVE